MKTFQIKNKKHDILKGIMYVVLFLSVIALFPACKKDNNNQAHLSVRMTDAPANYDAVMVDVQGVEVMGAGGNLVMLNANTGIYNLLDFTNGMDTLIASADMDATTISELQTRLL